MSRKVVRYLVLGCALAHQQSSLAEVPERLLETPLALAFGAPPTINDPMLSPDGTRLLFIQQNPQGVSMLRALNFAGGEISTLLQGTEDGYAILWCHFAGELRVLCDLRTGVPDTSPDYHRFAAVDIDGTNLQQMPQATGCREYDELRHRPDFDLLPDNPGQIQFFCAAASSLLDTYARRETAVSGAPDIGGVFNWEDYCQPARVGGVPGLLCDWELMDAARAAQGGSIGGGQRLYSNDRGFGNLFWGRQNNRDLWFVRDTAESPWQALLETDPLAFESPFRPVGYGADLSKVFNIAWDAETETWALYRMALTGDRENERVFGHEAVDVELVDTMGKYNRVVSAAFLDGRARRAIIDRRVSEVYEYVAALLPELEVEILDESWDQTRYLARVRAPNSTGEFLLVDMANETVQPVGPEYDHLTGYPLAETRLVQIEASTGGTIAAHLTLPHSVAWSRPASPVPAVIIPRSRPTHEDVADPHYLVQFLAANGYAVLRVNNRVEPEYGRGWLEERAIVGWQQSANDIGDSVNFLIENGISESDTICAAGKDYGAYTALMSAILYPELFRCLISIAGVTDPGETPGWPIATATASTEGENELHAASPLRRAAELMLPVLMFHGRNDADFPMTAHAASLSRALERAGKDVVFIEYPEAMHDIRRGTDRVDMLSRIRAFLAQQIGPELEEAESIGEP